jgi:hypothetical protein
MNDLKIDRLKAENIIEAGLEELGETYTQVELQQKLLQNDFAFSAANINKIHSKYRKLLGTPAAKDINIGRASVIDFAKGLISIFTQEQKGYNFEQKTFEPLADVENHPADGPPTQLRPYKLRFYDEGRRSIADKIAFIKTAKEEVIEMGIRLNSFSKYFINRRDSEFKDHIIQLLEKGVLLKCLMMDPEAELTKIYFADRAKADTREAAAFKEMPQILDDLKMVRDELNAKNLPGKMQIFLYENFPYQHYLAVDGGQEWGKMMYSSYIYGEKRANCPVTEIYKLGSPELYQRQWKSLQTILEHSKEV